MSQRPRSITLIGCLFVTAGVVGFAYHITEFGTQNPFDYDVAWVCFVRLLAILGGVFLFRRSNWARWLLVVWMGYHVVLSAFHTLSELAMHALIFAAIAYFLFRPQASAYFLGTRSQPAEGATDG